MKSEQAPKLAARMNGVRASNVIRKFNASAVLGRKSLAVGAALALSALALPAAATNWWNPAPTPAIGSALVNVKNMGAMGNGVNDDTAAIQAAINALPSGGGTVQIPAGTYMVNGLVGISLRSNTRISMATSASLNEIPNSAQRSWVLKVWNVNNVEIAGGNIVGDRVQHSGTVGQWGYGLNIEGSGSVYVHDIAISNCFGDGVLVGATGSGSTAVLATNVTLARVQSNNNRRQGLTIGPTAQLYVYDSSFTGSNGIAPQAGIDIEPQTQGNVQQVRIEDSVMSNNVGNGVEMHANVTGVVITGSTTQNNQGYGIFDDGANNTQIIDNNLIQNYLFGVDLAGDTASILLSNNVITYNGDAWFYANNQSIFTEGWSLRDITIESSTSNITQSNNTISPMR